jgi:demethylmenaquinone methyltransferase/2-methoxy-6-polyprenyl-1,4-benzoquinol methylase
VLEFSRPRRRALRAAYQLYFRRVLPWIGGCVSGDFEAYRYLPHSVAAWPSPPELQSHMQQAGLVDCGHALLSGGIACLHWGRRPNGDSG